MPKQVHDGVIEKQAIVKSLNIDETELDKINKNTLVDLTKEEVFTFKLVIANNKIDRDFERFTDDALAEMASLFIGKPLIKDHVRKADNQVGRIYDTELIIDYSEKNDIGEDVVKLVAHCYVLDNEYNKRLIDDIKGGIKKEVSLGVTLSEVVCSICGKDNAIEYCSHYWGKEYDGEVCYFALGGVRYANEVSFVVTAAQNGAGVTKSKKDAEQVKNTDDDASSELMLKIKLAEAEFYILKEKGANEIE